ncbi:hypothetical protein K8I31_04655 [bacterium]|nr:hypothetical protein [bacterium]
MYLPEIEKAYVNPKKLIGYLLSHDHPDGRSKAIFLNRLGYSIQNIHELEKAFLIHARRNQVHHIQETEFGVKYVIEGVLMNPENRDAKIRSIWIVLKTEHQPRFVTAYPVE